MTGHAASPQLKQVLERRFLIPVACGALTVLALLVAIPSRIFDGAYLNHVSGAWAALADDAVHGLLYRPLISDLGYGGTRYFPMHIVLHALFVKFGLSLRAAGHLVSVLAMFALVAGGSRALERRGASKALAWSGGALALASRTAFMGAAGVRGDLLPLALGIAGLGLMPRDRDGSLLPAGLFFGFALLAKPTLAWAPAGAFLALICDAQYRSALKLTLVSVLTTALGLAGALWWSHGELIKSFHAVASGGGFSLKELTSHLQYVRPGDLAWILSGPIFTILRGRRALTDPLCTAGLVCIPVMVVLFSGTGIHVNHLIDPAAIGALALVAAVADPQVRVGRSQAVLALATVLGVTEALLLDAALVKRGDLERTISVIPPGKDPILSEQPWVPLVGGERVFILDAFSLRQTRRTSPALDKDFMERVDHCAFRAIVLLGRLEKNEYWYDSVQFGPGFRQLLQARYSYAGIAGAHVVYFPHCNTNAKPPPQFDFGETETIADRGSRPSKVSAIVAWVRRLGRAHDQ